ALRWFLSNRARRRWDFIFRIPLASWQHGSAALWIKAFAPLAGCAKPAFYARGGEPLLSFLLGRITLNLSPGLANHAKGALAERSGSSPQQTGGAPLRRAN